MNNLIKKLQDNTTVHGELSAEARACFEKVGKENCEIRSRLNWHPAPDNNPFYNDWTYRIKSSYKLEPERIKLCLGMSPKEVRMYCDQWAIMHGEQHTTPCELFILIANLAARLQETIAEQ